MFKVQIRSADRREEPGEVLYLKFEPREGKILRLRRGKNAVKHDRLRIVDLDYNVIVDNIDESEIWLYVTPA